MMSDKNEKKEKKVYRDGLGEIKNPAKTGFGKVLIVILALLMFILPVISLIWILIQQF